MLLYNGTSAQCTINPNDTTVGFTPTSLPCITQGSVYGHAVQVHIPSTYTAGGFALNIDSVQLLTVTGQPAGITVSGTPASGVIHGGGNGCLWYSGTTNAAVASYPLTFNIRVWADFAGTSTGPQDTTLAALGYNFSLSVCAAAGNSCDTIFNVSAVDTPFQYVFNSGGYLGGNNSYGDEEKAEEFTGPIGSQVNGALILFGTAVVLPSDSNSTVTVNVMDATGAGGSPGAVIGSGTLTFRQIAAAVTAGGFSYVSFGSGPTLTSHNFFIAVVLPTTTGDTVAVLVNNQSTSFDGRGWEQWNDGTWNSYYDVYENGVGPNQFGNFIGAVTCGGRAVADFDVINDMGCGSATVTFVSRSSNGVTGQTWSFTGGSPSSSTATSATVTYSAPGSYNVTLIVTGTNGGDTSTMTGVVNVFPALGASVSTTPASSGVATDGSATVTVTAGTTPYFYDWSSNTATDTFATDNNLASGTYTVTVVDANGCFLVDTAVVTFNSGIATVSGDKQVKLYPNPANDVLNIEWNVRTEAEIVVTDVSGKEVKRYSTIGLLNAMDIHQMSSGVYVIVITDKQTQQQQSVKFTKL